MDCLLGRTTWMFPDMFWPSVTHGEDYVSHEAVCVLNTSEREARVTLHLFYEDREPIENLTAVCPPKRTLHIRMDKMKDCRGNALPRGVGYAAVVQSDIPVVAQYTRVDTTQPELALMTTMGCGL